MRRRFLRILAALAAATMATVMADGCYIGTPPDEGNNCWFICKPILESQAIPLSDA